MRCPWLLALFPLILVDPLTAADRLVVLLKDGSTVVGRPTESRLPIRTSYLDLAMPWEHVGSLVMRDDREGVDVVASNGDRLSGYPDVGGFDLETAGGRRFVGFVDVDRVLPAPHGPLDGLVAYYSFDGTASDGSGHGNHGALTGNAKLDSGGRHGGALVGNGVSGFLRIPDTDAVDTDKSFTLAAWVKPRRYFGPRGPDYYGFVVAKWFSSPVVGDYILQVGPKGHLGLQISNRVGGYQGGGAVSKTVVPLDEWTHVAATFDEGAIRLFVDGELDASVETDVEHTTLGEYDRDEITIGGLWNDWYVFDGAIDDVRIYDRALTPEEVERLHSPGGEADEVTRPDQPALARPAHR